MLIVTQQGFIDTLKPLTFIKKTSFKNSKHDEIILDILVTNEFLIYKLKYNYRLINGGNYEQFFNFNN
ncbi:MAG: hypothetical protein ACOCP8_00325 [archaeon]